MPLATGSRLGTYEIVSRIGTGGMGEVYRARDLKLSRDVAIKVLPEATAADPLALSRFQNEARAVAALSHANILAIHDFGSEAGVAFAVMELLEGETLRQRLDRGSIPLRRAVEIARGIALGLAAAHQKGIIHRDLKPENLFVTKDGAVKILDFGLARPMPRLGAVDSTLTAQTEPGALMGTVGYMSPEQVRGERADERSDIFSFGTVLYEMFSGQRAFKGDTSIETMNAILREEPPPLSENGRPIPPALERLVGHCLEKEPEDRFQSSRDLAFDIGALSTMTDAPKAGAAVPRRRWLRRVAVAGVATALAVLLFWSGVRFGPDLRKTPEPTFRRLTSRRGNVLSARFTPDGTSVVYSAAWDGKPAELFSVRTDSLESTALGFDKAVILSVSHQGELAILKKTISLRAMVGLGTLAQVPLGGNAAKELLHDVFAADWAPDGRELAVIRAVGGKERLEYPIGRVLKESVFLERSMRVSPDGALVVTLEGGEAGTQLVAFDRKGQKRALATLPWIIQGYDWSPDGREVLFVGGADKESMALRAVEISSGRQRVLMPAVGSSLGLLDVSGDGRILLERASRRRGTACLRAGEAAERDVSWGESLELRDVSNDGRTLLLSDLDSRRNIEVVYLKQCDASPPIRLGEGFPSFLSPDAQWALVCRGSDVWMLPTGPGSPRKIPLGDFKPGSAGLLPDGKRIALWRIGESGEALLYVVGLEGGSPRAVALPNFRGEGSAYSPDGELIAYDAMDGSVMVASLSGGEPRRLPGPPVDRDDQLVTWSADGRFLFLSRVRPGIPGSFLRREISTGKTTPWLEFQPADTTGVIGVVGAIITPDGRSYAYNYTRVEASDLFVVDGLR